LAYAPAYGETIDSKYFSLTIDPCVDKSAFLSKMQGAHFLQLDTFIAGGKTLDVDAALRDVLDALYLEVCDILDIHIYSLKIDLKVVPDKNAVAEVLAGYLGRRPNMPSFYYSQKNAIYISAQDFNLGMFSHEVAHAIITHYFVVPPPEKVQEVLAGYVEYSVRKKMAQ
jgi:hypothetical protein